MSGAGIGERSLFRIVDAVKGGDEAVDSSGVKIGEMAIDVVENSQRRLKRTGIGVRDAMRYRHQHGRRTSVPADIRNEETPFAVGQRKEVVIVAACTLRR